MQFYGTDGGRKVAGFKEKRDCTVRAVALCLGIDYPQAHHMLALVGRKPNRGVVWRDVHQDLGFEAMPELSCIPLEDALTSMAKGDFIVRIHAHVFAVVDGVVKDIYQPDSRRKTKMVYRSIRSLTNHELRRTGTEGGDCGGLRRLAGALGETGGSGVGSSRSSAPISVAR